MSSRRQNPDREQQLSGEQSTGLLVPGLDQVLLEFRQTYPELSIDEIRRLFRLPPLIEAVAESQGKGDR